MTNSAYRLRNTFLLFMVVLFLSVGQIYAAVIRGVVENTDQERLQNAVVTIVSTTGIAWSDTTDAAGNYLIAAIPACSVTVTASHPTHWPEKIDSVAIVEDDTFAVDFTQDHALTYPELDTHNSVLEIMYGYDPVENTWLAEINWHLSNTGSGQLEFYTWLYDGYMNWDGNDLFHAFDVDQQWSLGEYTNNQGFCAVALTRRRAFASAVALDDSLGANQLFSFTHSGTQMGAFTYPDSILGSDGKAFLDLASDSAGFLYGGNCDGQIYRMNENLTSIELVAQVASPIHCIAFDPVTDALYYTDSDSTFGRVDITTGIDTVLFYSPMFEGMTGMACTFDLPPSYDTDILCMFPLSEEGGAIVRRMGLSTLNWDQSFQLFSENLGSAGGLDHSWDRDPDCEVRLVSLTRDNSPSMTLYKGYPQTNTWYTVNPPHGIISPGEDMPFSMWGDLMDSGWEVDIDDEYYSQMVFFGPHLEVISTIEIIHLLLHVEENQAEPTTWRLSEPYPNPFNSQTRINFELPHNAAVKLVLYDILGREVAVLANRTFEAGVHTIGFDGANLASGTYFIRMEQVDTAGKANQRFEAVRKIILLK